MTSIPPSSPPPLQKTEPPNQDTKKLICISPGGFKGFYLSGIIAYIKEHYDVSDFYFSGASAGAWNTLLFTYRGNLTEFMKTLIGSKSELTTNETIRDYKYHLKQTILENYTEADFDLSRIFIGVTTMCHETKKTVEDRALHKEEIHTENFFAKTSIYSEFATLEDALDCCIASSHIPFVMGKIFHIYDNQVSFDGGFSDYPYYLKAEPVLNITSNMWNRSFSQQKDGMDFLSKFAIIEDYIYILDKDRYDFWELFQNGYEDSKKNRETLDRILRKKTI